MALNISMGLKLPDLEVAFEWEVFGHRFTRQVGTGELGRYITVTAHCSDDGYVWVSDSNAGTWTQAP